MLRVPKAPAWLTLPVRDRWDGSANPNPRLRADVAVRTLENGDWEIRARMPVRPQERIPNAPVDNPVGNLWEYDVAELFVVGPGHQYLEVELGAGGHFLVLGFDGIRQRSDEYLTFAPELAHVREEEPDGGWWSSVIRIPSAMVPRPVRAINAFVAAEGEYLAAFPVPGERPDFHQPDAYPEVVEQ